MPTDIDNALKNAVSSVSRYVQDVATMTVETKFVEIGATETTDFEHAHAGARTIIQLDGDCETVVPLQKDENGKMVVDTELFEIHQQNVATAIDYRARMLASLLTILKLH